MKRINILLFVINLTLSLNLCGQGEADIWYFGHNVGVDYVNGQANVISGSLFSSSTASSFSDSLGSLILATNGIKVINRTLQTISNGNNLHGNIVASQGALIVKQPGSNKNYYVFTVDSYNSPPSSFGLYYSVVNMDLNNGLGAVTNEKNVLLTDSWDAIDKIVGAKAANNEDIWIVTRKFQESAYASYRLTSLGVNTTATISPTIERNYFNCFGNMKISPDKKWLVTAYFMEGNIFDKPDFEVCSFNSETGDIEFLYILRFNSDSGLPYEPWGVEFSPDSKFLYLTIFTEGGSGGENKTELYQLDTRFINDSAQFFDSRIKITEGPCLSLQLASNGKIYCTGPDYGFYDYLSVINRPWEKGTACQYEADAVYLDFDGQGRQVGKFLPNILVDYLYRFEWEGRCQSQPFTFKPNFNPTPTYIRWSFSDPGSGADSISYELNPTHYFSHSGEFEVKVTVNYPNGRLEKTSRVVSVDASPQPDLGSDTLKCSSEQITLDAGNEDGVYVWSTGEFGLNNNQITISDTGWYWVKVTNDLSCPGIDSIYVGLYPEAEINETNLQIIPTSCGGSTGKILGLEINGQQPLTYQWLDADDNIIGSQLDITNLSVGNYYLHIFDGNGCETVSLAYTITDAGDVEINNITKTDAHCSAADGFIEIEATPNPLDLLYSIDNGINWQQSPQFNNLIAKNYYIRARDQGGCEGVYPNNPVTINNTSGPQISEVKTTDEINYNSNGSIEITITESGNYTYSIDNGQSFQTNGIFNNLTAGIYECFVKDEYSCDTTFTTEVKRVLTQSIDAIAGNGNTCMGDAAVIPIKLNGFEEIKKFRLQLTYDSSLLNCDGYININPKLEEGFSGEILVGDNKILLNWESEQSISLDDNSTLCELVFGAKQDGMSGIDWATQQGESVFYNKNMEEVNADYQFGSLRIYTKPQIMLPQSQTDCEGDTILLFPFVEGGSGEVAYLWTGPGSFDFPHQLLIIDDIQQSQSGNYHLLVTDTIGCTAETDINIEIVNKPEIAFSAYDTIFGEPGFVLDAGGTGDNSYQWSTGDTSQSIHIYSEGPYSVEVQSLEGCISLAETVVFWGGDPFYMPDAFTPNGDGLNDEFKPVYRNDFIKTYKIIIYNRWGQQVFETENPDSGWNGTYNGQASQQGTYVYTIVYKAYPDLTKTKTKTGSFTLIR